jgi:hypothetical protein
MSEEGVPHSDTGMYMYSYSIASHITISPATRTAPANPERLYNAVPYRHCYCYSKSPARLHQCPAPAGRRPQAADHTSHVGKLPSREAGMETVSGGERSEVHQDTCGQSCRLCMLTVALSLLFLLKR